MTIRLVPFLLCAAAFGQTPDQTSTFTFAHTKSPHLIEEAVKIVRSLGAAPRLDADPNARAVTIGGRPSQIAAATRLLSELDRPAGPPPERFTVSDYPDGPGSTTRILLPVHIRAPERLREIATGLQSVRDLLRVAAAPQIGALIVRTTTDQAALVEWILRELDGSAGGSRASGIRTCHYRDNVPPLNRGGAAVRIYYPATIVSPAQVQEAVAALRSIADVQRIVTFPPSLAILLRADPDEAALADWLFGQIDQPAPAPGVKAYRWEGREDGFVLSIVMPKDADVAATLAHTRTSGIRRVVAYRGTTIVLRGTASQTATAEQAVR